MTAIFERYFFMMIKNLEAMGFVNFICYSIFIFACWVSANGLVVVIEKIMKVSAEPRWYDVVIMLVFISAWLYGIFIYQKYTLTKGYK